MNFVKQYYCAVASKNVDPNELEMGIKVEKEHTDDEAVATQIALDHLAEISDYYSRLKIMEQEAFSENGE